MPWPDAEFNAYAKKAAKAMGQHPYGRELTYRFADLLERGVAEPVPECRYLGCYRREPVRDLGAWVARHSVAELQRHILTAEDEVFTARVHSRLVARLVAMRAAGWMQWRRRGDVRHRRTKKTWLGVRTK